jgi:hypothetical protein
VQNNAAVKGHAADITYKQFSRLLRLPIPQARSTTAAMHRNTAVKLFINKLKAARLKTKEKVEMEMRMQMEMEKEMETEM